MSNKNQYSAYNNAISTMDEFSQMLQLYDGAIRFIEIAKQAILDNNQQEKYNNINKACNIINGLSECLDMESKDEKAAETAKAMSDFYFATDMKLLKIQNESSVDLCNSAINDIRMIRDTWEQIFLSLKKAGTEEQSKNKKEQNQEKNDNEKTETKINGEIIC